MVSAQEEEARMRLGETHKTYCGTHTLSVASIRCHRYPLLSSLHLVRLERPLNPECFGRGPEEPGGSDGRGDDRWRQRQLKGEEEIFPVRCIAAAIVVDADDELVVFDGGVDRIVERANQFQTEE